MYYRTIRNDIQRNKAITLTIMIIVAAAAMLVSLAAILVVNLSGAIDPLMNIKKKGNPLPEAVGMIFKKSI